MTPMMYAVVDSSEIFDEIEKVAVEKSVIIPLRASFSTMWRLI